MKQNMFLKLMRWSALSIFSFLLICRVVGAYDADGYASGADLELPQLLAPTGAYDIGTVMLHLVDGSRLEQMTPEADDCREIMVQVWYPTDQDSDGAPAQYMDSQTSAYMMQSAPEGQPDIFSSISTHAFLSAPPAGGPKDFPLLIFSPGLGMCFSLYQVLIEDIVSHGYVVAAINHPYVSGITVFPDGRTVLYRSDIDNQFKHRVVVNDIKFLTGELESVKIGDSMLVPDVENIGFWGHSFGGSASIEACLQLPQGKGAMDIDGSLRGQSHYQPIEKPLFFMLNQHQPVWGNSIFDEAWRNLSHDGYLVRIDGAGHGAFSDFGILLFQVFGQEYFDLFAEMIDPGTIDPQRAVKITREYIAAFFDNCLKDAPANTIRAIQYPEAALEELPGHMDLSNGIWRSKGYGYLLEIENSTFSSYEAIETGLLPSSEGYVHGNYVYSGQQLMARMSLSDNRLMLNNKSGKEIIFEPADDAQLPMVIEESADPELNFQVFWQTFKEHCALFDLTHVDWKTLYEKYRPRVSANTTDEELFDILSDLAGYLNDGHTTIVDHCSGRSFASGPRPGAMWTRFKSMHLNIIASFMDGGVLNSEANGLIRYGTVNGSTGYVNILAFKGLAGPGASMEADKFIFSYLINTILKQFQNIKAIIIDCRFNRGGYDQLALDLAGRFVEHQYPAFSKRVRIGDDHEFSTPMQYAIEPGQNTFLNVPVILLTSNATMGAAEVFVMTMEQLDNVILIGEKTYGAFSNPLPRTLPNGWSFTLSNERYCSWEGIDYEQQGLLPDIEIRYKRAGTVRKKELKDNILERSLVYLNCSATD